MIDENKLKLPVICRQPHNRLRCVATMHFHTLSQSSSSQRFGSLLTVLRVKIYAINVLPYLSVVISFR